MPDPASPATGGGAARPVRAGRAVPKRRAAGAGSAPTARSGLARSRRRPSVWPRALLLASAGVVGLPLAHAMLGEAAALLSGAVLLGFVLGRWTAPG